MQSSPLLFNQKKNPRLFWGIVLTDMLIVGITLKKKQKTNTNLKCKEHAILGTHATGIYVKTQLTYTILCYKLVYWN